MDPNVKWFYQKRAESVIESLKANRMNGVYVDDPSQVAATVMSYIPEGSTVAMGGSVTMMETGVVEALRQGPVQLIDRYQPGISPQETMARLKLGLSAQVFVSGVNAVTEEGELVFVDATCNRVAPILFGPDKVILIAGCNKIVPNLAHAQERIRHFVAPTNARRIGRKTPCAVSGHCEDCSSPERICNATVVIHKQARPERLSVVLVGANLGY
ncbi:MAG: lactate utilization protein [Desulfarculus sp.]|nr:lactate utilization protein [Desulfarculus sp.]